MAFRLHFHSIQMEEKHSIENAGRPLKEIHRDLRSVIHNSLPESALRAAAASHRESQSRGTVHAARAEPRIPWDTDGAKGGSKNLKTMLQYLQHSTADNAMDDSTKELHDYVCRVKTAPEVKEDYMRFEELIEWERAEAAEQTTQIATQKATQNTKIQDILELLEDYGEIPDTLMEKRENSQIALPRNILLFYGRLFKPISLGPYFARHSR